MHQPGFGAKFPNGTVDHCFALNHSANPACDGMGGVEAAYKETLRRVSLWGPTNFAEFINRVAQIAREAKVTQERQQYFVLLILTDGIITDMDQTKSVSGCTVLRIA